MTPEIAALGVGVLLQMVVGILAGAMVGKVTGTDWLLSSRETDVDFSKGIAGRLARARGNGFEALTLFTPAVAVVALSSTSSDITLMAAWSFVIARVLYTACYAFDLVPWRTVFWFVGTISVLVMILAALLAV